MARCIHCGSETDLIVSGLAVCVACDETPKKTLDVLSARLQLGRARARWRAAKRELTNADEIMDSLSKGHPDGTQALRNANASLKKAGEEVRTALNEYLRATGKGNRAV